MNRKTDYKNGQLKRSSDDIDYYDFMEMLENGLTDLEIADEFGVSQSHIKKMKNQLLKDY
ncbi:MAG: hypothetical protein ACOYVK_02475 [Bacillota bacterium]